MKKNCLKALTVLSFAVIMSVCSVQNASAVFELFDGKLQVSGFIKETAYYKINKFDREYKGPKRGQSTRLDFLMTSAYLETLVNIKEDPFGWNVRLFTGLRYWWEKAPLIDGNQYDAIADFHRNRYMGPRSFVDDMLTECYLDIQKGPWQVKLGKQIVIWGQNDVGRVADVVNPLKLVHGVPGVDTWEEVKRGLWMIRAFYQSNLPGNLLFEVIFDPGDHKAADTMGYAGTHWGEPYSHSGLAQASGFNESGIVNYMAEGMQRANPSWDIDETYSFGGRIMGQTGNFNWSVLIWNRLMDLPLVRSDKLMGYGATWAAAQMSDPFQAPSFDNVDEVFDYKRFTTIGGTVMTEWPWLHYTTWDLEWFYEINSPLNQSPTGDQMDIMLLRGDGTHYPMTRKDIFGFSLKVGDRFRMPDFMNNMLGTTKKVDWTFTYFFEKVLGHNEYLVINDRYHKQRDSVADGMSFWCKVELFNSAFAFVNISSYYLKTSGQMHVPTLVYYFPISVLNGGLRATVGVKIYLRQEHDAVFTNYDKKDSIIMRLSYEF